MIHPSKEKHKAVYDFQDYIAKGTADSSLLRL